LSRIRCIGPGDFPAASAVGYWAVDCAAEAIEVYRRSEGSRYRDVSRIAGAEATVTLPAFPDVTPRLADIFA
jgi:hypothetical protein